MSPTRSSQSPGRFADAVRVELDRLAEHLVALHEQHNREEFATNGTIENVKLDGVEVQDRISCSPLQDVRSRQLEPLLESPDPFELQFRDSFRSADDACSVVPLDSDEDSEKKSLMVKIACAYNLRDADSMCCMGSSDPYCICRLKDEESNVVYESTAASSGQGRGREFRTVTINNNLNPVWNHVGYFEYDGISQPSAELEFIVMDADFPGPDDLLGKAYLSLAKCKEGFSGCLKLMEAGVNNALLKLSVDFIEDDSRSFMKLLMQSRAKWPSVDGERVSPDQSTHSVPPSEDRTSRGQESRGGSMHGSRGRRTSAKSTSSNYRGAVLSLFELDNLRMGDTTKGNGFMDHLMCPPNTRFRMYWEFLCFWTVLYDLMAAPAAFAFDLENQSLYISNLCITLFWTSDMIFTFFTGFSENGVVELRFERVASRYFKSWFPLDALMVIIDWFFCAVYFFSLTNSGNFLSKSARILKVGRFARSTKMISLLRILKMKRNWVLSAIGSKPFSGIIQAVSGIFFFTHIACCMWYAIGTWGRGETWLVAEGRDVESESFPSRYSTAFEWALAQFTPSPVSTHPTNVQERIYKIFIDFCGLLLFSNFLGAITAKITQMRASRSELVETENNLQRYFEENRVPMELGKRVLDCIRQQNRQRNCLRIHESQIPALKGLPERLLSELRIEIRLPPLLHHPFFVSLYGADSDCVFSICSDMLEKNFLPDEEVFSRGSHALGMYIVAGGKLAYLKSGASQEISCSQKKLIWSDQPGQWVAEPALWIDGWCHRGDAVAVEATETFCIDAGAFQILMDRRIPFDEQHEGSVSTLIAVYASNFVREEFPDITWNMRHSDLWSSPRDLARICDVARKAALLSSSTAKNPKSKLGKFLMTVQPSV